MPKQTFALCAKCGTPFSVLRGLREKYCSRACYVATQQAHDYWTKRHKLSWEQRKEVVQLYTTPLADGTWMGAKIIGTKFGVTQQAVNHILKMQGVAMRDAKEAHAHGKQCKPVKNLPIGKPPLCRCGCSEPTSWNQHKNGWQAYAVGHYHSKQAYHDHDWLYNAYITQNRTMGDIARQVGICESALLKSAKNLGIPIRDHSASRMGRHKGPENGSWKGGTTPERQRLYKQGHWRQFCQKIYERDGFHCRRCGAPKTKRKGLHVHHLKAWAGNPSLRFDEANVLTLCYKCHTWVHSSENHAGQLID